MQSLRQLIGLGSPHNRNLGGFRMCRYKHTTPQRRHKPQETALTLDAFVSQVYLPAVKARKRSWEMDMRVARQHLSPFFGHRVLAEIAAWEVEDWINGLLDRGLAPSSCNRFLAVFKSICAVAENRGFLRIGASPCGGVASLKEPSQRERCLLRGEARSLMRHLEQSGRIEALVLRLLLLTGARKREILHARWENVHLEQRLLTVPLSKSGKARHIVLSDAAIAVIRAIPRRSGASWLFPGQTTNRPLSDIYLFWNKVRREIGLEDVRIHDLRHSFASFLVNAGHSLYEVQKMLGHADPRTTMRYAHLGRASLVMAAETVGGMFEDPNAPSPTAKNVSSRKNTV